MNKININWIKHGQMLHATHCIIVCDTISLQEYPDYVIPPNNIYDSFNKLNNSHTLKVMEIYNLSNNISAQLNKNCVFEF